MKRYPSIPVLVFGAALMGGCDDGNEEPAAVQRPPNRGLPEHGVDAAASPDAGGAEGGVAPVCERGAARCPIEGGGQIDFCFGEMWQTEDCPDNGVCLDAQCVPDPAVCQAGERICLGDGRPAVCDPATGMWQPQASCENGDVCVRGQCVSAGCARAAGSRSYLGCDYLVVELPNVMFSAEGSTPNSPTALVVANPDLERSLTVRLLGPDGLPSQLVRSRQITVPADDREVRERYQSQTVRSEVRDGGGQIVATNLIEADGLEIPAGGLATLLLPRPPGPMPQDTFVAHSAFRLQSSQPVAAYQFSPYCCNFSFSNDASLLIPTTALDDAYVHLGVPGSLWPAGIAIVGVDDGTEVTVTLRGAGLVMSGRDGAQVVGNRVTATLDSQEVLLVQSRLAPTNGSATQPDLSGARIDASARVAVFSTHECAFYPNGRIACDHLQEQLFPISAWGESFALVPPVRRNDAPPSTEAVYWKIAALNAEIRVTLSRPFGELRAQVPGYPGVTDCANLLQDNDIVFNAFDTVCEFGTMEPVGLQADGPLMVMGTISGQGSTRVPSGFGAQAGDPAIFLVPPDRQYRAEYTFLAPGTYANDYVTVVADPAAAITLDGQPLNLDDAIAVPGIGRVYKHLSISDGAHRLTGDSPFGILVFAFDDFVSYAFTGGLNLTKR